MTYLKKQLFGFDADGKDVHLAEISGLSTDSKPTAGLVSGSTFLEVDTGKTYVLDADSATAAWTELITITAAAE